MSDSKAGRQESNENLKPMISNLQSLLLNKEIPLISPKQEDEKTTVENLKP